MLGIFCHHNMWHWMTFVLERLDRGKYNIKFSAQHYPTNIAYLPIIHSEGVITVLAVTKRDSPQ